MVLCTTNFTSTLVAIILSSTIDLNFPSILKRSVILTNPPVLSAISAKNPNLHSVPLNVIIETETLKLFARNLKQPNKKCNFITLH